MHGLILDLRDNPGGLLSAAVEISDLFLERRHDRQHQGPEHRQPRPTRPRRTGPFADFPMVVLVNQNSASAAEIVSACLQDHKRAMVVGQRSYGKGSVQNIIELEDGNSVLKLTVATYHRPSGKNIHRFKNAKDTDEWGVSPDPGLEVKLAPAASTCNWFLGRRDRDLVAAQRPPAEKPAADQAEAEEKDEDAKRREGEGEGQGDAKAASTTGAARRRSRSRRSRAEQGAERIKFEIKELDKALEVDPVEDRRPRTRRAVSGPTWPWFLGLMPDDRLVFLAIETTCDETGAAVLGGPAAARRRRAADPLERGRVADRPARAVRRRRARDRLAGPRPPDPAGDRRGPAPGGGHARATWARSPSRPGRGWSVPWSSA